MGWLERNDLLDWIRLIVDSDDQARILLFGGSMGATTVMMTTGTPELPRNVIAQSPKADTLPPAWNS